MSGKEMKRSTQAKKKRKKTKQILAEENPRREDMEEQKIL